MALQNSPVLRSVRLPDEPRLSSSELSGLLRTVGNGCLKAFMLRAVMWLSPFLGYRSNTYFNSMREAE